MEPVQSSTSMAGLESSYWTEVKSQLYTTLALQLEASPFTLLKHSFLVYQGDMYISFLTTL